jgi:hypothetical protein
MIFYIYLCLFLHMAKSREQKKRNKKNLSSARYYAKKIETFLGRDVLVFIPTQHITLDNMASSFQNFVCLIPRVSSTEKMFPRDKRMKFIFISSPFVKLLPKKFNVKHLLKPVEDCKICMEENSSLSRICPK